MEEGGKPVPVLFVKERICVSRSPAAGLKREPAQPSRSMWGKKKREKKGKSLTSSVACASAKWLRTHFRDER